MYKVAIDPGHRRDTPGKRYADFMEWEFNDDVAKRLKRHLENNGFNTLLTIETDTHTYPETTSEGELKNLQFRANRANNWGADIFVSIHANAHSDINAQGYEVYILKHGGGRERLARLIEDRAKEYLPELKPRGIKTANFAVLRRTIMPAMLIEHGFFTNEHDRALLQDDDFREKCAIHLAAGICDFFATPFKGEVKVDPIKEFQREHGLMVDGIVGPETQGKALELINTLIQPVKAFQRQYGLAIDGIIGRETITKLVEVLEPRNTAIYSKVAETYIAEIGPGITYTEDFNCEVGDVFQLYLQGAYYDYAHSRAVVTNFKFSILESFIPITTDY